MASGAAHLVLRQLYRNPLEEPIEARYLFPAPAAGAISRLRFRIGEDWKVAELRERKEAVQIYETALLEGHRAGLLEQERDDLFTMSLGNIPAGGSAEVEVQLVLPFEGDPEKVRIKLPTYVFPRYVPDWSDFSPSWMPSPQVPDADRIIPPYVKEPGYRAELNLRVEMGFPVAVSSPSHGIAWQPDAEGDGGSVHFLNGTCPLDRDLILLLRPQRAGTAAAPIVQVSCGEALLEDGTVPFAVSLLPELPEREESLQQRHGKVVFVLDRSGSMAGSSIATAKQFLERLLKELRSGDAFELLAFDNTVEATFGQLVPYSPLQERHACSWLRQIKARGGTELGEALCFAVENYPEATAIVLLTDSQVGNEAVILSEWGASLRGRRLQLFALGVGQNVASGLLDRLTKESGGWLGELHPGEDVDEAVREISCRLFAPALRIRSARMEGVQITDVATSSRLLRTGEPWTLWALARPLPEADAAWLEIVGELDRSETTLRFPIELSTACHAPELLAVWGHARIRELESARSLADRDSRREACRKEIVAVSLRSGVLSSETAFVGVLPSPQPSDYLEPRRMRSVSVPHAAARYVDPHYEKRSVVAFASLRREQPSVDLSLLSALDTEPVAGAQIPRQRATQHLEVGSLILSESVEWLTLHDLVELVDGLLTDAESSCNRHLRWLALSLALFLLTQGKLDGQSLCSDLSWLSNRVAQLNSALERACESPQPQKPSRGARSAQPADTSLPEPETGKPRKQWLMQLWGLEGWVLLEELRLRASKQEFAAAEVRFDGPAGPELEADFRLWRDSLSQHLRALLGSLPE